MSNSKFWTKNSVFSIVFHRESLKSKLSAVNAATTTHLCAKWYLYLLVNLHSSNWSFKLLA